jgi:hypothetical protein
VQLAEERKQEDVPNPFDALVVTLLEYFQETDEQTRGGEHDDWKPLES